MSPLSLQRLLVSIARLVVPFLIGLGSYLYFVVGGHNPVTYHLARTSTLVHFLYLLAFFLLFVIFPYALERDLRRPPAPLKPWMGWGILIVFLLLDITFLLDQPATPNLVSLLVPIGYIMLFIYGVTYTLWRRRKAKRKTSEAEKVTTVT